MSSQFMQTNGKREQKGNPTVLFWVTKTNLHISMFTHTLKAQASSLTFNTA